MSKKLSLSKIASILLVLAISFQFNACDDAGNGPVGPPPVISSFTPTSGEVNTGVAVLGPNLTTSTKIFFQGATGPIEAPIISTATSSGDKVLFTQVPAQAKTGKISVSLNGITVETATEFTVLTAESVLQITPTSGAVQSSVVITGANLGSVKSAIEVFFPTSSGTTTAIVSQLGETGDYLVARVPSGAVDGAIKVKLNNKLYSSVQSFDVRDCNVSTLAGGAEGYVDASGTSAKFGWLNSAAAIGNVLYVSDRGNSMIRKVDLSSGAVTTLAGSASGFADGTGAAAKLNSPAGLTVGKDGQLYVADEWNHRIRKINPSTGAVSTVAGSTTRATTDGIGVNAAIDNPRSIATGPDGMIYFTQYNHAIRKLNPTTGEVTTIIKSGLGGHVDGSFASAQFSFPEGMAIVGQQMFVCDNGNEVIRKLDFATNMVTTIAGGYSDGFASTDGVGLKSGFNAPTEMITDGTYLYITDANLVRRLTIATGAVTTMAGKLTISFTPVNGACLTAEFDNLKGIAMAADGTMYVTEDTGFSVDVNLIRKIVP